MRLRSLLPLLMFVPGVAADFGMPEPLTERGEIISDLYSTLFIVATIVFLLVMALLIYVMVRFRANGGAGRQTFELERDNLKMELAWIGIPLVVVLWIGVISYAGLVELDEGIARDDAFMELEVTGYQWTWLADYGSGISLFSDPSPIDGSVADDKVFVVPADVPIWFNVTGGDVIHAWHVMDANWATVGLVDANPYGPHKYNGFTAVLPVGEYEVQCREMCFNPGHGYMRARLQAVPMAEFEGWMEEKGLRAGAGLPQEAAVSFDGTLQADGLTFVTGEGSRAIIKFSNDHSEDVTVSAPGFELITAHFANEGGIRVDQTRSNSLTVPAGATMEFAFDIAEAGTFFLSAGGEASEFEVIEAEAVQVDLGDFFINPSQMTLEAGKTYLFQVNNIGATSHNIFIGSKPSADEQEVIWESATIDGGASTSFIVTPTETVELDSWCNVPGHWPAMAGTIVIQ